MDSNRDTSEVDALTRDPVDGAYHCPACDAPFTRRSNLRRHYTIHTRGTGYQCEICSRSFARNDQLRTHIPRCQVESSQSPMTMAMPMSSVIPPPHRATSLEPGNPFDTSLNPILNSIPNMMAMNTPGGGVGSIGNGHGSTGDFSDLFGGGNMPSRPPLTRITTAEIEQLLPPYMSLGAGSCSDSSNSGPSPGTRTPGMRSPVSSFSSPRPTPALSQAALPPMSSMNYPDDLNMGGINDQFSSRSRKMERPSSRFARAQHSSSGSSSSTSRRRPSNVNANDRPMYTARQVEDIIDVVTHTLVDALDNVYARQHNAGSSFGHRL